MNTPCLIHETPADNILKDNPLKGVLEPLASYICAAQRPRAALLLVYKALLSEVEQTDRVARSHFGEFVRSR